MKTLTALALLALSSSTVFAAQQSVALTVPTMNCVTCPITVKKSLTNVDGVLSATVFYDKKLAMVTFDDTKTNVAQLTKATKNAGYPSTLVEKNK
ncbi:mercuric transport protein periplasmic component [Candidatus Aerophobetes bacterium]|uniref:Periplasmic mercury ion-binding protein n=1 Tax=Aerophobetes bacterium TaxID=2030807 RepID=A0A2A4YA22_UNCAE|nr:MAG: mercuric transport protein periplasmic component [Candidatus Aerophobetes bacterium]